VLIKPQKGVTVLTIDNIGILQ